MADPREVAKDIVRTHLRNPMNPSAVGMVRFAPIDIPDVAAPQEATLPAAPSLVNQIPGGVSATSIPAWDGAVTEGLRSIGNVFQYGAPRGMNAADAPPPLPTPTPADVARNVIVASPILPATATPPARHAPVGTGAIGMTAQEQANAIPESTVGTAPDESGGTPTLPQVTPPKLRHTYTPPKVEGFDEKYVADLDKLKRSMDLSGQLTEEQRNRNELGFWLAMLAAASKPGARAGEAVGEAGMGYIKATTEQERYNKALAMDTMEKAKTDLYRIAQLADKRGDNERAVAQLNMMDDHYQNQIEMERARHDAEAKDRAERLQIEREKLAMAKKQFERGDWQAYAVPGQPMIAIDKHDPTKVRQIMVNGKPVITPMADSRPAEIHTLEYLRKLLPENQRNDPAAIMKMMKGRSDRDFMEEQIGKDAVSIFNNSMGKLTMDQARAEAMRARGMPEKSGATTPTFNTPEEVAAAKKAGKVVKGDQIMTPQGPRIVN